MAATIPGAGITTPLTLTEDGNNDTLTLTTTDADGSIGPNLRLYRNSASPADNDDLATIDFEGRNDNSQDVQYGMIRAILKDASDGTEDGLLEFHHMKNGTLAPSLQVGPDEVVINESSNDYDFRVESNGDANMLFVDGGNNAIGVGTNSPALASGRGMVVHGGSSVARVELRNDTSGAANSDGMFLTYSGTDAFVGNREAGTIQFWNNGSERARITSSGQFLVGASSSSRFFNITSDLNSQYALHVDHTQSTPYGVFLQYTGAAPDSGSDNYFLTCNDGTTRLFIYSNGDVKNHDGVFTSISSDERLKSNIVDANSQWDDIKAIKFRNFKKKDDIEKYGADNAKTLLGVVAQEAESVTPKLVRNRDPLPEEVKLNSAFGTLYEDGDDIPEGKEIGDVKEVKEQVKTFKDSILFWKCAKALQEAQTRIETLETKVKALEDA